MSNTVTVRANGPLILRGHIMVKDSNDDLILDDTEVYLCRCGKSKNSPFCDGEHKRVGFVDAAQFTDNKPHTLASDIATSGQAASLVVSVREKAMLIAKGPMTIQSEDQISKTIRIKAALCCCGASENKPFCDAAHKNIAPDP